MTTKTTKTTKTAKTVERAMRELAHSFLTIQAVRQHTQRINPSITDTDFNQAVAHLHNQAVVHLAHHDYPAGARPGELVTITHNDAPGRPTVHYCAIFFA